MEKAAALAVLLALEHAHKLWIEGSLKVKQGSLTNMNNFYAQVSNLQSRERSPSLCIIFISFHSSTPQTLIFNKP